MVDKEKLTETIDEAVLVLNDIKDAIVETGVEVPEGTPASAYGAKVAQVYSAGAESVREDIEALEARIDALTTTEPDTITWDGNTDGLVYFDPSTYGKDTIEIMYRISDAPIDMYAVTAINNVSSLYVDSVIPNFPIKGVKVSGSFKLISVDTEISLLNLKIGTYVTADVRTVTLSSVHEVLNPQHLPSGLTTQDYVDAALAQKSLVQIVVWEADD